MIGPILATLAAIVVTILTPGRYFVLYVLTLRGYRIEKGHNNP